MKSTIRFTGLGMYSCKQMNFVSTSNKCVVEYDSLDNITGLAVKDEALLKLEIPKEDENFVLTIGHLGFEEELDTWGGTHQDSQKVSGYLEFGYPHNINGLVFVIDPNDTAGSLRIVKTNSKVEVFFKNTKITEKNDIVGPLLSLHLKNNIEEASYYKFIVNNVIYDWGYETAYGTLGHLNYVNNYH